MRIFAGEALERERYGSLVAQSYSSGIGFSRAKALLECVNRSAVHLSMLALYALGGAVPGVLGVGCRPAWAGSVNAGLRCTAPGV